jgi:hypothetical protein
MKRISGVLVLVAALAVGPALAETPTDAFATCLVDNLTGKERKDLAKWIFFAMAVHPEIKAYSNVRPADTRQSDEFMGKLVTRLLTVNCPGQFRTANAADPMALQKSFELVGQVAMQELITNPDVERALTTYAQYADETRINNALSGKPEPAQ